MSNCRISLLLRAEIQSNAASYLKAELDFASFDAQAYALSDNEAARQLNEARDELFAEIRSEAAGAA